jgi:predicted nucleotidyltransferase component of viral defense system
MLMYPHSDKDTFVQAIRNTASQEGFSEALIEKDYYCSLILRELYKQDDHKLIFKGGTLLNKVHAGFYRLSEDLDFSISAGPTFKKNARSKLAQPMKASIKKVIKELSLSFSQEPIGRNESSQYNGEVIYESLLLGIPGTIKIEISIRDEVLEKTSLKARTLVKDPFTNDPLIPDFDIQGLSLHEAYAEKLRAAMARVSPAIRDIFDVEYALKRKLFRIEEIAKMVRYKFEIQGRKVLLSNERKEIFRQQLDTHLKPVLREKDFQDFNFDTAWNNLISLEKNIFSK